MVPEKRVEDIIKAYLLNPRGCSLVVVGDNAAAGQYMKDLLKMASNTPSVIFTGYQFGPVLEELFSNARAYVTASELEGLPITLLEALSYGVICVTSNIGPHRELTDSLKPGLSFPVGDVGGNSKFMDRVETMTDTQLDDFKKKAIAMISEAFSWDATCGSHDRLYRESLGQ